MKNLYDGRLCQTNIWGMPESREGQSGPGKLKP